MIRNYSDFNTGRIVPINEDWKEDLMSKVRDFASELFSIEEIEDSFLELVEDYGFELNVELKLGYLHNGQLSSYINRKIEVVSNQCFPLYEIRIIKKFKLDNTTNQFRKKLELVNTLLNKYDIASDRIMYSDGSPLKILKSKPDFTTNQLRFDMIIMVNKAIPDDFIELEVNSKNKQKVMNKVPYGRALGQISNSKAFILNQEETSSEDKKIVFSVDPQYQHIDVKNIILRMMRDIQYNLVDNGNSYEITIL